MLKLKRVTNIILSIIFGSIGIFLLVFGLLNNKNNIEEKLDVNDERYIKVINYNEELYNMTVSIEAFKNEENEIVDEYNIDELFVASKMKDVYYIALGDKIDFNDLFIYIGNLEYTWNFDNSIVEVNNNVLIGTAVGESELSFIVDEVVLAKTKIVVTDTIVAMPKDFDNNKMDLPCGIYTKEQAELLDEILENRVSNAGYGTRAGVVAAARFLTLEFTYKIAYYYENGRLNSTGRHYVDGEGRYYHKGLYLDESKYESIEASLIGPAMWGCLLRNLEPNSKEYVFRKKYPNGLDCSGFVTWVLLNGGFDVGDRGAGESPSKGQLTDLGDFKSLSNDLIYSDKIKVGDLLNFWGHISIIVGIDDNNFYVAESLNTYYGVVVKKYPKNKVRKTFSYVVLMEDVYKNDGNITNMWY